MFLDLICSTLHFSALNSYFLIRNKYLSNTTIYLDPSVLFLLIMVDIEYCTKVWAPVFRYGNWSVILKLVGIQRRVTKLIKRVKDYSYNKRLLKLGLTTLIEVPVV